MSDWDGPRRKGAPPAGRQPRSRALKRGRKRPPGGPWFWIFLILVLAMLAVRCSPHLEEEVESAIPDGAGESAGGTDWEGPRSE